MVSMISVLFSATINLTVLFFKVGMLLYRLKIKSFFAPQKEKKKEKKHTHMHCNHLFFILHIWWNRE